MSLPWNDFLATNGAVIDTAGVHFPDAPAGAGVCVVPLLHLGLIRCMGEDATDFLHNLLSSDVRKLPSGGVQWSSFNTPKGRMLASLIVNAVDGGHELLVSAELAASVQKRLSMYVLRSKVTVSAAGDSRVLLGLCGPHAAATLEKAGLQTPAPGQSTCAEDARCLGLTSELFVLVLAADAAETMWTRLTAAGAVARGSDTWTLAMIRAGLPLITAATQEEFVAQMLNYELIGGVNFNKGCYPGQEIIARTQYLGKLKKRMYRMRVPAGYTPAAGEDVFTPEFGEQSAGKIVNAAPDGSGAHEALVVMQTSCAQAGEAHIGRPDGPPMEFLDLPYTLA